MTILRYNGWIHKQPMIPPSSPLKTPLPFEQKTRAKQALQKELKWVEEPRRPLIIIPQELDERTGGSLIKEMLPGLLALDICIVIRGRGSASIGSLLTSLHRQHPECIAILPDTPESLLRMIHAGDMALFCHDPSKSKECALCLMSATIPIAPDSSGSLLHNYDPVQESGNAFLFERVNPWHAFAAIVRACETFKLPFDWRTIQRHCLDPSH